MKDNRYPDFEEEEGIGMCSEPLDHEDEYGGNYDTIEAFKEKGADVAETWDPGIGPYDKEELNARIDEAEVFIEKAERGDWSDWVSETQSRANLYSKYPWLR
jgi:hypothetical protein